MFATSSQVGRLVLLAGFVARQPDGAPLRARASAQTERILDRIAEELDAAGASLADVVRMRVYLTAVDDWSQVKEVLDQRFGEVVPASTVVQVSALVEPWMAVEIEAEAEIP